MVDWTLCCQVLHVTVVLNFTSPHLPFSLFLSLLLSLPPSIHAFSFLYHPHSTPKTASMKNAPTTLGTLYIYTSPTPPLPYNSNISSTDLEDQTFQQDLRYLHVIEATRKPPPSPSHAPP